MDHKKAIDTAIHALANVLRRNGMYTALLTLGKMESRVVPGLPFKAAIKIRFDAKQSRFHAAFSEEWAGMDLEARVFIMLHELRHIYQAVEVSDYMSILHGKDWLKEKPEIFRRLNIAMDVALHQDIKHLFEDDHVANIEGWDVRALNEKYPGLAWPERGSPQMYFALLAEQMQDSDGDEHKDMFANWDELSEEEKEAVRREMRRMREQGRLMRGQAAGTGSLRDNMEAESGVVPPEVAQALRKIQVLSLRAMNGKGEWDYSHSIYNRIYGDLPGRRHVAGPSNKLVVVLDTSGSMCSPETMGVLAGAVNLLVREQKVGALYCCDTELYEMKTPESVVNRMVVKGGGGTTLDSSHVDLILKKMSLKKVEIVYLTDGHVDLEEIRADRRVKLHAIVF